MSLSLHTTPPPSQQPIDGSPLPPPLPSQSPSLDAAQQAIAASSSYGPTRKVRERCSFSGCRKRITPIDITMKCLCELVLCRTHRLPMAHNCPMKRKQQQEILRRQLMEDQSKTGQTQNEGPIPDTACG